MRDILKGATDQSVVIRIIDNATGVPETAVEHDTSGIDLWYRREGATKVSITEVALAALDTAHTDGGIEHIGDGYYRLDPPDAAFASGVNGVMFGGTVTGMVIIGCYIHLVAYDVQNAVRLGLTALPNAAADAAGGLPISDAGGLDLDAQIGTDIDAILVDTAEIGAAGAGLTNINLPNQAMDIVGSITGNLSGSVGSVTGAVGSIAAGGIDSASFASQAITNGALATNAISASKLAADASAEIAGAVWDEDATAHQTTGTFGQAIGDPVADTNTIFKAVVTDAAGATVGVDVVAVKVDTAAILVDTGTTLDAALAVVDANVDAILVDTAEIGAAGAGLTAVPWNASWDAEVQSEATDALNAYDPPTNAEMDARTLPAANYATAAALDIVDNFLDTEIADILVDTSTTLDDMVDDLEGRLSAALATALQAHSLAIGRVVIDVGSTTTAVVLETVNGSAASAVNDFYNGRVLIFTSGALTLQATSITDYVGATKTATVPALTSAPADDVTAVLV